MRSMTTIQSNYLEDALEEAGFYDAQVRSYSGRAMYGRECAAVVIDDMRAVFGMFAALGEADQDLAQSLAEVARTDSMGLGTVVYFPGFQLDGDEGEENR